MSAVAVVGNNTRSKFGWIMLLVATALMLLNHSSLIFILNEPVLFIGFTVFNLYALLVLWIPFRRGEMWAWWATWLLPIGLALPAFIDRAILYYYLAVATFCIVGLLLTRQEFVAKR